MNERRKITIERTFEATLSDVWGLWTTKEGIESWWGPEGFSVKVEALDLRPGGELRYVMTATAKETIAFMKSAGMPESTRTALTYVEVTPKTRLVYTNQVDFVPEVKVYDVDTVVEFAVRGKAVHLLLALDAMHDPTWTGRMKAGWESELGKLARALEGRVGQTEGRATT